MYWDGLVMLVGCIVLLGLIVFVESLVWLIWNWLGWLGCRVFFRVVGLYCLYGVVVILVWSLCSEYLGKLVNWELVLLLLCVFVCERGGFIVL